MWDLDTIRYQNEQAHLQAVERAERKGQLVPESSSAPVFPLATLSRLLITGPPLLSDLVDLLENSDVVADFHNLVREFLPEHEAFIMSQDNDGRIREFAHYFARQYFPLSDSLMMDEFTLGDFLREIPVDLMGFGYDDYHQFNDFRTGYILMLALVESPFAYIEGDDRVPILVQAGELVGKGLVELIPQGGWSTEDLRQMLGKSDLSGVADFADWLHADTGCWQLDASFENYEGEVWSRHVVDQLTIQWPRVNDIQDNIGRVSEWLEEDPCSRFKELLNLLLDKRVAIIPKEQLPFPLDETGQFIEKEVTTDGNP